MLFFPLVGFVLYPFGSNNYPDYITIYNAYDAFRLILNN